MTFLLPIFAIVAANALLASIWQGVLLALAVALTLRLLPGLSAAARSLIWTSVFAVVLLLHLTPLAFAGGAPAGNAAVHLDARWSLALGLIWLALSVFRGAQLLVSAMRLHMVARRATPISGLPQRIGRRSYLLCTSLDVDRPSVAGFFAPRILLPPTLYASLSADELQTILLHETEHLRRRDDWSNLLQKAALVLFPLNPVLLWVERRLCLERELACDDRVLRETGAPKAYATCLTALAEHSLLRRGLSLALGAFGRESELSRRVHRILRAPQRTLGAHAAASLTAVLVLALSGGGYTLAHSPQLISFSPMAGLPSASLRQPARTGQSFAPSATFQTAGFHEPKLAQARAAKPRKALRVKRSRPEFSGPRVMRTEWRSVDYADAPRLVLTSASGSRVSYTFVPAVVRMPAYAAVSVPNGWIIFQL